MSPIDLIHLSISWSVYLSPHDINLKFFSQPKSSDFFPKCPSKQVLPTSSPFITFVPFFRREKIRRSSDGWLWGAEQAVDSITTVSEEVRKEINLTNTVSCTCSVKNCLTSWHTPLLTGLAGCWKSLQQSTDVEYLWILMAITLIITNKEKQ